MTVYPGEREKLKTYTFKIPREWVEGLEAHAKKLGTTRSRVSRAALYEYIQKYGVEV